ncbi:phosphoribosyltransferase [Candidatus Roizmanbacteria bacterium]|nr:phosphoribosyltransferase [Candidatus Roizmanbacteria bacterium]
MIFKDRPDAGRKLLVKLFQDKEIKKNKKNVVVVSLLRGGIVVGDTIAKGLQVKHLPLVVTKIPAPHNPELAIGALCFAIVYLEKSVVNSLNLEKSEIVNQIKIAREKFNSYTQRFGIKKSTYGRSFKNKLVILTDDGIATGSTVKAAILYLRSKKPKSLFLAVPVTPDDFYITGVDKLFILHKDVAFGAVSQFYEHFPQVEDEEVKRLLKKLD